MVPKVSKTTPTARICYTWCAALLGSLAFSSPVQVQNKSDSPTIHISRAPEPPRLEWFVHGSNGAPHARSAAVTDFLQREPGDGTPVSQSTTAFVDRVGSHQTEQNFQYKWRPDRRPIVSFGPEGSALFNWERTGRLQDRNLAGTFAPELVRQTRIELSRVEAFERFTGLDFEPRSTQLFAETKWKKWLALRGVDMVPGSPPSLRRIGGLATSVGRQLFAKVSYLLRF